MIVKLLTEHHLECLRLKGGGTGPSEARHVKMPHCRKSHITAHIYIHLWYRKFYICRNAARFYEHKKCPSYYAVFGLVIILRLCAVDCFTECALVVASVFVAFLCRDLTSTESLVNVWHL